MKDLTLESLVSDKENLERILDNLSEGIFAHDMERRILFFNRAAEEITGYRREDVVGKDCHEALGDLFAGATVPFRMVHPIFLNTRTIPSIS